VYFKVKTLLGINSESIKERKIIIVGDWLERKISFLKARNKHKGILFNFFSGKSWKNLIINCTSILFLNQA